MYPADWDPPTEGFYTISFGYFGNHTKDGTYGMAITDNDLGITIDHRINTNNESLDEYINQMSKISQLINLRDITIDGIPAKAWTSNGQLFDFYHLLYKGEQIGIIKYPITTTKQKEFDQIVSTFQFTDK